MMKLKNILWIVLGIFVLASCNKDDETTPVAKSTFKVTIENVFGTPTFFATGKTGLLMPGESSTFSFHAGKGSYLSLATMFVQSNDLFYGFAEEGLALYDASGNAITGDVTNEIDLWDAGTEVNETPGMGMNQPPSQSGPNTGMTENGTIHLVADGFTYPMDEAVIKVSLAHDGGTEFTITIENLSGSSALPTPLAPGVWVIHGESASLFTAGQAASAGMEALSEDGNNEMMSNGLMSKSGYNSPFAPGVWAVHDSGVFPIFEDGKMDFGKGLEALSEDGDPSTLGGAIGSVAGVLSSGVFNTPDGASSPGPLLPASIYSFTFTAEEGDYLNFATMLVQTNDLFFAFDDSGIALFNNGTAVSGDVTSKIKLWDAGTEVNEYPGAGNNQPVRGGGNSGAAENGTVTVVNDGFTYPAVMDAIKVTITPM